MATRAPLPADSLLALAELLSSDPGDGDEDSVDASQGPAGGHSGPGSIGPRKADGALAAPLPPEDGKAIWSAGEVPEGGAGDASWDPREQPEYVPAPQVEEKRPSSEAQRSRRLAWAPPYQIVFKQHVRAEDLFLGMSGKDSSTACCEDMLIKIKLPDTKASDITLDIQEKLLDFRSPQKRLLLHLPHPVDATNGKARFLSEQSTLEVTLRMKRELDFINFS